MKYVIQYDKKMTHNCISPIYTINIYIYIYVYINIYIYKYTYIYINI